MHRVAYRIALCLCMIFLVSCHKAVDKRIVVFDPLKDYPEFPLTLYDVAEVRFIKLGGEEENIYYTSTLGTTPFIDETNDRLFLANRFIGILEYSLNGNYIRTLGRIGRGPGEYSSVFFYVQPEEKTVGIYDNGQRHILTYNYNGDYLRDRGKDVYFVITSPNNFHIYENALVYYNPYSLVSDEYQGITFSTSSRTLYSIPINGRSAKDIKDIHYERPIVNPSDWGPNYEFLMLSGYLIPSYSGLIMSTYRSDTTFVIEKDMSWRPFLVNSKHNGVKEGCLYPVAETREYLFLCHKNNLREGRVSYFAIDKKTKLAYKITKDESSPLHGLLQGKIQIDIEGLTKNPDYRFWEFDPEKLKKTCYDLLSPELKTIVDHCDEGSNPILMVMKFKE